MITTTAQVTDAVAALTAKYTDAALAIQPDLETNTQTALQVANFQSVMAGVLVDIRALRVDLDGTDTATLLVAGAAQRLSEVWRWERETRHALAEFTIQALESFRVAGELTAGTDQATVVTREGDTLQAIAARELGDFREWPRLLDANPGLDAGALASGLTLIIPEVR